MSIHRDTKRGQFIFEFDRTIEGKRVRARIHPTLKRYMDRHGWPIEAAKSTIQKWSRVSRAKVGLEHVTFHSLRHSTASALINADVDLFTVGAILGHKDPRSTKRYAHLAQSRLTDAIAKMGQKKRA